MRVLIILVGFIYCTQAFMFGGNHAELNQNATLICIREPGKCIMEIRIASTDRVDLVYYENPSDSSVNSIGIEDSKPTGTTVTGTGSQADPWLLRVDTNCTDINFVPPIALSRFVEVTDLVLSAAFMVKSVYNPPVFTEVITFVGDVRYKPVCNFTEVGPETMMSRQLLSILGGGETNVTAETDVAVLEAYNAADTSKAATYIFLGGNMYWQASIANQENSTATGVYLYNCDLCDSSDCSKVKFQIVDAEGCSTIPSYVTAFTDPTNSGLSKTNQFTSFQLSASTTVLLRCSVGFCYYTSDGRCTDLCTHNTSGRKKRAAGQADKVQIVVGSVRIEVDPTGNNTWVSFGQEEIIQRNPVNDSEQMGLIAAVISLSALLVVGLCAAVCVFFRLTALSKGTSQKA